MKGKKRPTQWKIDGDWVGLLAGARRISGVKRPTKGHILGSWVGLKWNNNRSMHIRRKYVYGGKTDRWHRKD